MPTRSVPLPADDPTLRTASLDELELRWAPLSARTAISAEVMTGLDHRAQGLGISGDTLMEHAGTAVAAAARALLEHNARMGMPVLILAGPGNNGG
ncbi:MAG: NAD(P)H-hydrate epimerase, partial [Candidatus Limnocylindrales bacterium]